MPTNSTGPIACRYCDLVEVCRQCGIIAQRESGELQRAGSAPRTLPIGARLFRAGEAAHSLFAVRQGMLKTVDVGLDGEEHVVAVNMPGDALGTEAFGERIYAYDVVAVQPVVYCKLPLSLLSTQFARVHDLANALINLLSRSSVLRVPPVRGTVHQRVVALMLDLSRRLEQSGFDGRRFSLGMTRQEIASLLGTRIETVSRTIQKMHRAKEIAIDGQQVTLLSLKPATA
ncbi:MAG: Crp/Fnr family transcriptional regulator [Pseudomonadales bacterium]|nr:Crp/Fnr family transcriptional regulator [Pseudomonadales bacterium]